MKYNIKNHFENVYLRSRTIQRYMPLADPNILKDREFKSAINYISRHHYYRHERMWNATGFGLEDLESLARIWGLTFSGMDIKTDNRHGYYLVMFNFIDQRINGLKNWINKKFKKDVLSMQYYDEVKDLNLEEDTDTIQYQIKEQLRIVDVANAQIENSTKREKRVLKSVKQKASYELRELNQIKKTKELERQATTSRLKTQLSENPMAYSEKLLYYANSTDEGLRNRARSLCRRYGIEVTK